MINLTEREYDQLINMFKEKLSYSTISRIMGIPLRTVSREHRRWELCKALYIISHPAGELTIPVNGKIYITDKGYNYLISLFKENISRKKISRLTGVPINSSVKFYSGK